MNIGDTIPLSLSFQATNGLESDFGAYRGQWLVIYFYPKDSTPGCTIEGKRFRDLHALFTALNAVVLGVSRDNLSSHERFKCKHEFPFELIADTNESLCQLFDVVKTKSMFGKKIMGIERSTFIINPEGILKYVWRKVKVFGHADEVLAKLTELENAQKNQASL